MGDRVPESLKIRNKIILNRQPKIDICVYIIKDKKMALDFTKLRQQFNEIHSTIGREELENWLQKYDHYFDQPCEEVEYYDTFFEYSFDKEYERIQDQFDKQLEKLKVKKYSGYRNNYHSDYHRVGDDFPWKIADRVLNNFIGKPFDDAFHKFCQLVPKYQQKCFLEEFEGRYASWFVDDDGNILPEPPREKRKTTYKVASWDAKYDWILVRNKDEKARKGYKFFPSKVFGLIEGEEFIFNRPDHRFKRIKEDQRKKKLAQERKSKKKQQEDFSILLGRISRERRRMEHEKNLIKIISHGFDPKTSFRPDNQK